MCLYRSYVAWQAPTADLYIPVTIELPLCYSVLGSFRLPKRRALGFDNKAVHI